MKVSMIAGTQIFSMKASDSMMVYYYYRLEILVFVQIEVQLRSKNNAEIPQKLVHFWLCAQFVDFRCIGCTVCTYVQTL